jgi:O-antigen/teichoic acid export membrane protein
MNKINKAATSLKGHVGESYFKLITDLAFTTGIGGVVSVLNYMFNVVLALQLPEKSFSTFSAIVGLIYIVQIPAVTLQTVITKIVAKNLDKDLTTFKNKNVKRFIIIGLIVSAGVILISPLLSDWLEVEKKYLVLLSIVVFAAIFTPISKGLLLGLQKVKLVNTFNLIEAFGKLFIVLILVQFSTNPGLPILAYGLPMLVLGFVLVPMAKFDKNKPEDKSIDLDWKEVGVVLITYFLFNAGYTLDILLVDPTIRASYASLALLGKIVYFASIMITSAMFANVAKESSKKGQRNLFLISIILNLCISLSVSAIYFLFGDQIVEIVFKGKYSEISQYIGIFGLGMAMYSASFLLIGYLIIRNRKLQIIILALIVVLQIVLFQIQNSTLQAVVTNQIIIYTVMALSLSAYWAVVSIRDRRSPTIS